MIGFAKGTLYQFINTYTGESKWLPMNEGQKLIAEDDYWELDNTQKPISIYDESML